MKRFIFFSMNDFTHEGGGTIRMLGIMNELSKKGHDVIFISNTTKPQLCVSSIKHVAIDFPFTKRDKRIFQGLLGMFPISIVKLKYAKLFSKLELIFKNEFQNDTVYFCEYLDNSIGYALKKLGIIQNYINDLHGVATLEFKFQAKLGNSISEKIKFYIKYKISDWLDRKVCNNAKGLIFASQAMKEYFIAQYPKVAQKQNFILPYLLSSEAILDKVDFDLKKELEITLHRKPEEKIIFFAGAFKKTGGVPDLILAFKNIHNNFNSRLFIVGDGPTMKECHDIVEQNSLEDKVVFIGRIPYHQLRTYQDLADVIVCPDKQNVYSELIVHVKYLDSLLSKKVVVNGSFKSVQEINADEFLSLNFIPSDIQDLSKVISYAIEHNNELVEKYKNNFDFVSKNLTYTSQVDVLI